MDWTHRVGQSYGTDVNGDVIAKVNYEKIGDRTINIEHVYVDPAFRGQGIAGQAMKKMVEFLRENKWDTIATCPYAKDWLVKHQVTCKDVIAKDFADQVVSCKIDKSH